MALLRLAAEHQYKVGKGELELPATEMPADMLRLAATPEAALAEYRISLQTDLDGSTLFCKPEKLLKT